MKRIFTLMTVVASTGIMMTACNTNPKAPVTNTTDSANTVTLKKEDTVGLAALKAAQAQEAARQAAIANVPQKDTVVVIKEVPKTTTKTRTVYKNNPQGSYSSNGDYAAKEPATTTTTQKKGWSKAAKGTAIGAGTGAVIGGIAGKGKGAIIGGIIGGAAGYGVGRHKDKKDGRVQ